jgi:putative hemolysin
VDGLLNLEDFEEECGLTLPEGPYETVAGFVISVLGHLPAQGEAVETGTHRITVTELDGRRVARVRVSRRPEAERAPEAAAEDDESGGAVGQGETAAWSSVDADADAEVEEAPSEEGGVRPRQDETAREGAGG